MDGNLPEQPGFEWCDIMPAGIAFDSQGLTSGPWPSVMCKPIVVLLPPLPLLLVRVRGGVPRPLLNRLDRCLLAFQRVLRALRSSVSLSMTTLAG